MIQLLKIALQESARNGMNLTAICNVANEIDMLNIIHGAGFKTRKTDRSGFQNQWCFALNLNDVDIEVISDPIFSDSPPASMVGAVGRRRMVILLIPAAVNGDPEINLWWNEFTKMWESVRPGRKDRVYEYFVNFTGQFGTNVGIMTLIGWSVLGGKDRVMFGANTGAISLPGVEAYNVSGAFTPLSLSTMIDMWNAAMTLWKEANDADLIFPTLTYVDGTHFTLGVPYGRWDNTIMFSNMTVIARGYGEEPYY